MNRRNFIFLAGALTASVGIPTWYYQYRTPEYDPMLAEPESLAYIWDENTMLEIGKKYLSEHPDEKSERKLVKSLLKKTTSNQQELIESLQQLTREDYVQDHIVMVDGWLLSVSEARQCALYSLIKNPS